MLPLTFDEVMTAANEAKWQLRNKEYKQTRMDTPAPTYVHIVFDEMNDIKRVFDTKEKAADYLNKTDPKRIWSSLETHEVH